MPQLARVAVMASVLASCTAAQAQIAPDDDLDDRPALQAAIDATARNGGGTVQLERGTYDLSGPIFLRSGVVLAGRGAETILSNARFNRKSTWAGVTVFAGNLTPGNFDDNSGDGYRGIEVQRTSDRSVTVPVCSSDLLSGLPGEVVWLSSARGFSGPRKYFKTESGEMNLVEAVDGCTLQLSDPIDIPAAHQLRIHWSDGSKRLPAIVGEPNRAIRDAGLANLQLVSAESQALLVTGCYRCTFTGVTMGLTRRLIPLQGARGTVFRNVRGIFTEKGIEAAMFASHNVVEDVRASYRGGSGRSPLPAIRIGEYARANRISDVALFLGTAYAPRPKIRFDESSDNVLENVRLVVASNDNRQLFSYRGPGAERGKVGQLPPGTSLRGVELCAGEDADRCEAVR